MIAHRLTGAARAQNVTLSESVYEQLREDILSCRLLPNSKLKLEGLRSQFDAGLTPLREALSRLAGENLVVFRGQRGFKVAPVSLAELEDLTFLRSELEPLALRLAMEAGDDAWEAQVVAAHHHLSRLPRQRWKPNDPALDAWTARHIAFHDSLVSACGSERLLRIRATLFDHAQRYQRLFIAFVDAERDDAEEHRLLCEATVQRDSVRACHLIRSHVENTAASLREALQKNGIPESFSDAEAG